MVSEVHKGAVSRRFRLRCNISHLLRATVDQHAMHNVFVTEKDRSLQPDGVALIVLLVV